MPARRYAGELCRLYEFYNSRTYVHPDPLEFLYNYKDIRDREIAGIIASSLAYGSVYQILKTVESVLKRLEEPRESVLNLSQSELTSLFRDFKYRFTTGHELAVFLYSIRCSLERHGSLEACFLNGYHDDDETILPALTAFVEELSVAFNGRPRSLLPSPGRGSACKRLHLYMRWMVRCDDVDPGGWNTIPSSKLLVPMDVHMQRICSMLGITRRKQADLKTVREVTDAFRAVAPDDPVRFDFCLTRLGIHPDADRDEFVRRCRAVGCEME